MYTYQSTSPEETFSLGLKIAQSLKGDECITLEGDLGTGKTLLAKGLIKGLGIYERVTSPTFTIIHEYYHLFPVYHIDLYRIYEVEELYELGFEDYLYGEGVVIIEWPQIAEDHFLREHLQIELLWSSHQERALTLNPYGRPYEILVKELKKSAYPRT